MSFGLVTCNYCLFKEAFVNKTGRESKGVRIMLETGETIGATH
jgi:hypothetical protein